MLIALVFLLGIGNFAVHKAVLESRHPAFERVPQPLRKRASQATLAAEFVLLLGTLLLVASGHPGWAWGYLAYSALNGLSGWLILSRRI